DRTVEREGEWLVPHRTPALGVADHHRRHLPRQRCRGIVELIRPDDQQPPIELGRARDTTSRDPLDGARRGGAKAAPVVGDEQINHANAPPRRADLPTQPQCAQVNRTSASSLASGHPQMHTQPWRRAGFPTTSAWAGTSLVTTAPMPTMA